VIEIARMSSSYRLGGAPERRAHLARRLDRIVASGVATALENVAGDLGGEDGPVYRIRRLDLALWLNAAVTNDADIARSWATSLARALYRQIAEGGPGEVIRYPSRAAFLAAWLSDLVDHRSEGRWEYDEFGSLDGVRTGRAAAFVLAQDPRWIRPVFGALRDSRRSEALIRTLEAADVEVIWSALAGVPPAASRRLDARLIEEARRINVAAPVVASGIGAGDRARGALRWLLALSVEQGMPPRKASGLAMQLAYLDALLGALPSLRSVLGGRAVPPPLLEAMLVAAPRELGPATDWLAEVCEEGSSTDLLRRLRALAERPGHPLGGAGTEAIPAGGSTTMTSAYAGVGLLLPALRDSGLGGELGPEGIHRVLVAATGASRQDTAGTDPALRWLAGLPEGHVAPEAVNWPTPEQLNIAPEALRSEAEHHGSDPELAALRSVADLFSVGLRGMSGSSLGYLARQFFRRTGTLVRSEDVLEVHLHAVPLAILLRMGGRLGDQGAIAWLDGRRLIVETGDG
jgi:hypothetical protein